jgi:hypothetical protein
MRPSRPLPTVALQESGGQASTADTPEREKADERRRNESRHQLHAQARSPDDRERVLRLELAWERFEELEGEDRVEVEDLIAEGTLKIPTKLNNKHKN